MEELKLNETPVRTSKNYNINNIKLNDINIPDNIGDFTNVDIIGEVQKVQKNNFKLTYGVGEILTKQVKEKANQNLKLILDENKKSDIQINFNFDEENLNLVDNIEIIAKKNCTGTIVIKYHVSENIQAFHNGIIRLIAEENSNINIIVANLMNSMSNHFISIENNLKSNAKAKYTIVDFGGKNSITNYYSNLEGEQSENVINTIYLGKENQLFDLNYIGELRGEKSDIEIEVQGALKDKAKKHFKGTIDFKKGCKKARGNENEACMLLSDTAKSIALPMLLCSEEEVEGNHSSSAGKIGEKELFYIMSRGFEQKEAMKLMVKARFNKILDGVKIEELKNKILDEIDKRLD